MEASKDDEGKRPYKRKLTEKRRIQNRAAQRIYRAKRKERLEHLERAAADAQSSIPETDGSSQKSAEQEEARDEKYILKSIAPIKRILDLEDEADAEDLLEFVVTDQPDLKKIVLTGLRTLISKKDDPATQQSVPVPGSTVPPNTDAQLVIPQQPLTHPLSLLPTPTPTIPDRFINGIILRHQTAQEVYFQNAHAIGLTWEQVTQHTCQSPFHASLSIIPTCTPPPTVPPDLHPTPSQLNHPHHPFLDLIPFPWFRHRAIAYGVLDPPPYDPWELKKDILDGGLVCWKSRARSAGQPWDRRSWEVEPWFLKKWGWLVEEQGKVEMQSKWWRELRGEQ